MAITAKQLSQKRLNRLTSVSDPYIKNMESVAKQFQRKLESLLSSYNGNFQAIDAAAARSQITGILVDSGYYEVVGDLLSNGYQELIDGTLADYSEYLGETLSFHEVSLARLEKIREAKFLDWEGIAQRQIDSFQRIMINASFGSGDLSNIMDQVQAEMDDSFGRYGATWVETSLSGWMQEESNTLATDAGLEYFEYVHPLDNITRPFCEEHAGEIKTLDEWDALDNGQIDPVSQYLGGYNCRGQLIPTLTQSGNE